MMQEIVIATIQTVGTLGGVGLAAYFVVNQIKLGERLKLKLDIYREVLKVAAAATNAYGEVAHQVNLLQYSFIPIWLRKNEFPDYEPAPPIDALSMSNLNAEAGYKAADLLTFIQNWTVIEPRVRVFHTAVNVALHDMRTSWSELYPYMIRTTAMFSSPPNPTRQHPAHKEDWSGFAAALRKYGEAVQLLDCYVTDLQTEMQNELLGDLFKTKSPTRIPIDPQYRAVALRDAELWQDHFVKNTPWGAYSRQLDQNTAAQVFAKLKDKEKGA
jgi:hypothetical protein